MKNYLNQSIDYSALLGKVICKRLLIDKKWTSAFIQKYKNLFINCKNTKKVQSADSKRNYLLIDNSHSNFNQKMKCF